MEISEETKRKLLEAGRPDLLEIMQENADGVAGVLPNGNLVDRRKLPEAYPIMGNPFLGVAPAKELENDPHAEWFKENPSTI